MNFSEMVKAAGFGDPTKATVECSSEALAEIAESVAKSGEPVEISERKFLTRKRAMIENMQRAIDHRSKIFLLQDTRWLENG